MKYLVFNAVVFLALGYLIMGGDSQNITAKLDQGVQKAKAQIEQVISQPIAEVKQVEAPVKPVVSQPIKAPAPVVEEVVATKPHEAATTPARAPALPKAVEVAKHEAQKIPSRAVEPAEQAVAQVDPAITQAPAVENTLVDAKERSKELRQMVADMERMFAEKMTR